MKGFGLLIVALGSGLTGCGSGVSATASADSGTDVAAPDTAPDAAADRIGKDAAWITDARVGDGDISELPATSVEGSKACVQATEVRRSCDDDWDCVAALHVTDCCGSAVWLGIRASAVTTYDTLEAACERSYSACTCAAHPPTTDDGVVVRPQAGDVVSAHCQRGACKTFTISQ